MKNNQSTPHSPVREFTKAAQHLSGSQGRAHARIICFDLARGFTVLLMPAIHVCMLYSTIPVQQSLLGDGLGFIAEGPGAQLFMLLMGVNVALKLRSGNIEHNSSTEKSFSQNQQRKSGVGLLKKSLRFIIAAYALNVVKFLIPLSLDLLPENLLEELHLQRDTQAALFFLSIGDILHFAALATLILYVITRTRYYPYLALGLAVATSFLSPYLWDHHTGNQLLDHLIGLFNGHPPQSFFPVFPWLVYPLIGLTLGYLLQRVEVNYLLKKTGIIGIALIILSCTFPATTAITEWLAFYRTGPADTLFHLGFVLVWLACWQWISRKIKDNPFFRLLRFCSRHITSIYIIQWILICWCLGITGYLKLDAWWSVAWMILITANTLMIAFILNSFKKNAR